MSFNQQINLTKTPFILYPNSGWQKPFSVKFTPMSSDCQFSTSLRLHTNSSFFTIPLHCYDGKLKYEVQDIDKDSLEYGLMRYTDTISKRFLVININPVKVACVCVCVCVCVMCVCIRFASMRCICVHIDTFVCTIA